MQEQIQASIQKLKDENVRLREQVEEIERLRQQIEENEAAIRFLESMLPNEKMPPPLEVLQLEEDNSVHGEGEPPVPGAIPALTDRDKDGNLRIRLCRTYAGEGWIYTPVTDGWITITHESDMV